MKVKEGLDEKAGLINETRLLADFRSENLMNCIYVSKKPES